MNNTSNSISNALLIAPYQLNIWFGSFLWLTGNIGCLGNMIVFRCQSFRQRAYSIYLFAGAVFDFYYFNFVLLTRIIQKGFRIPIINDYILICKLRQFSTEWGNVVSFTLFSLATIDRLLSTKRSNKYRQWSNRVYLAYKMILFSVILWTLLIGHRIIFYRIKDGNCGPPEGFYTFYDNYFQVIISSLSPAIIMSILAYLLNKSVHEIVQRKITPINNIIPITMIPIRSMISQMDGQLTLMLVLESLIVFLTYIPYAIQLTYANITQDWSKSPLRKAWESLFTELIHLFSYVFFASNFYVSILTNTGFRRKITSLWTKQKRNNVQDHTAIITIRHPGTIIH